MALNRLVLLSHTFLSYFFETVVLAHAADLPEWFWRSDCIFADGVEIWPILSIVTHGPRPKEIVGALGSDIVGISCCAFPGSIVEVGDHLFRSHAEVGVDLQRSEQEVG